MISYLSLYLCLSLFVLSHSFTSPIRSQFRSLLKAEKNESNKPTKIGIGGLIQLITMGAGAPSLGEFDRVDPETGKMFFKLEANNLTDKDGNSLQTKAKYFNEGYVEKAGDDKPPGFFKNLLSGGKLQEEWEEKMQQKKK